MRDAVAKVANLSSNLVILITIIVLAVAAGVLEVLPIEIPGVDAAFRVILLVGLLELLGLAILTYKRVDTLSHPSGIQYVAKPDVPNPVETARAAGATKVYICASSIGRSNKHVTALLDAKFVEVCLFSSASEPGYLPSC